MIVLDSIGWLNTALPLLALVALALLIPRFVIDRQTRSHWGVVRGLLVTALLLLAAGFALSMLVTASRGFDVESHMMQRPAVGIWLHLQAEAQYLNDGNTEVRQIVEGIGLFYFLETEFLFL